MTVDTIILFNLPDMKDPLPLKVEVKVGIDGSVYAWRGGWERYYADQAEFAAELIRCREFVQKRNEKYEGQPTLTTFDISEWVEA